MINSVSGVKEISSKVTTLSTNNSVEGYKEATLEKNSSDMASKKTENALGDVFSNKNIDRSQKKNEEKLTEENVDEMSDALNDLMKKMNYDLEFSYYKDLDRLVMKVVDRNTQETIKQMPPEEMLKTLTNLREWIGVFLDKNA